MKMLSLFDPDTLVYTGDVPHPLDPVESERAATPIYAAVNPALAAEDHPGVVTAGYEAVRGAGVWTLRLVATAAPAPLSLTEEKSSLKAAATKKRWQVEAGGITLPNGTRVLTTVEDQNRISNAASNGLRLRFESVQFKDAAGNWGELPLAMLVAIADAVALHVQACFAIECAHHLAIDALDSVQAAQAYDINTGWTGAQPKPAD